MSTLALQNDSLASPLWGQVLILNKSYQPIHLTSVKRAMCMLVIGAARAMNEDFQLYDFKNWQEFSQEKRKEEKNIKEGWLKTPSLWLKVPRILVLQTYYNIPIGQIRFSRQNIYVRDKYTCQYCGVKKQKLELNFDHVVPRSQGGKTTWENVVTSCIPCNSKKGGRTPKQAGLKLLKEAKRPKWSDLGLKILQTKRYKEWKPFVSHLDAAYWHSELED